MLRSPLSRAVVVLVLLAGLVGLGVWFGSLAPAPELGDYPREPHLDGDYDRYVGDRVVVSGPAVETDPVVVDAGYPDGSIRLTVTDLDREVERGDLVWVFGVARPGGEVRTVDAVVITPAGFRYGRGISLVAGLWVLSRLVRDWRLDRERWGLVPDGGGDGDA